MDREKELLNEYKSWILAQPKGGYEVRETEDGIKINSDFAVAEVNFYEIEDMTVVELRITRKKDDETAFFLHFELRELPYAKELYREMMASMEELKGRKSVQVLLACTSALTTGLMAEKLNDTASMIGADFHFNAVPYSELYQKASGYDMVLLAPQVAYEEARIKSVITNIPVVKIPPRLFATYDAPAILESVRQEFENRTQRAKEEVPRKIVSVEDDRRILTITVMFLGEWKMQMISRLYRGGKPIEKDTIYKPFTGGGGKNALIRLITDSIDALIKLQGGFDSLGITLPGEIRDGTVFLERWISPDVNLRRYLEERYSVPVVLKNNTQAGVWGFHSRHGKYNSAVFLSQSLESRMGGAGILVNGQLWEGAHHSAGEIKYMLKRFYGLHLPAGGVTTPREMLYSTDLAARGLIAIINPEILLVRNALIPDINELRTLLAEVVPERNMPKLRKISDQDALEYMMLGIMGLCLEAL